jgi:hypothetical protein
MHNISPYDHADQIHDNKAPQSASMRRAPFLSATPAIRSETLASALDSAKQIVSIP